MTHIAKFAALSILVALLVFPVVPIHAQELPIDPQFSLWPEIKAELAQVKETLQTLSKDVEKLSLLEQRVSETALEAEYLKRELDNALMDVSNFLAVGDRNMDAASAAISASETYIDVANFWAAILAIFVAFVAIAAAGYLTVSGNRFAKLSETVTRTVAKEIAEELTAGSPGDVSDSSKKIIRHIREAVKGDLEAAPALALMQSEEFKANLERLIDTAVAAKMAKVDAVDDDQTLRRDDFED